MTTLGRDRRLLHTFTQLADTLVDDYDVVELMQELVDTSQAELGVAAAGLLLTDSSGTLELIASTSESESVVAALILGAQGPADGSRGGASITVSSIDALGSEWRAFTAVSLATGFTSIVSIPLRLRDATIGSLILLQGDDAPLGDDDLVIARALADVATIGILHERALRETEALAEQLQHALRSRVVIEQAKGVVSYLKGVPIDDAFVLIRGYARSHGERLSDVARRIVERRLVLD